MRLRDVKKRMIGTVVTLSRFLLDTNVCIYCLDGNPKIINYLGDIIRNPHNELILSVITEAELFSSIKIYNNPSLKAEISSFINSADEVKEITREIAYTAGEIRAYFHQNLGKKIKLPDALIAATAIHLKATLVSNNDRDFTDALLRYETAYYNPIK